MEVHWKMVVGMVVLLILLVVYCTHLFKKNQELRDKLEDVEGSPEEADPEGRSPLRGCPEGTPASQRPGQAVTPKGKDGDFKA